MGKVKARNIIDGWPRGKSTSVSYENSLWDYVTDDVMFRFAVRGHWTLRDDLIRDAEYHRDQQRMLDRHRSEYRRPHPAWLFRKIIQYGGGLAIATCGETPDTITLGEGPERPWRFDPTGKGIESATTHAEDRERDALERFFHTNVMVDHRER